MAWTSKSEADNPWTAELDWDAENPSGVTTSQPIFDDATDQVVCLVVGTGWEEREFDQRVNLIAAAPELLEALKAMLQHSCVADAAPEDKFPEDHDAERSARAAVAKAEGRP